MTNPLTLLLIVFITTRVVNSVPVILRETSPTGEAIVAISSSDPNIEKYIARAGQNAAMTNDNGHFIQSISVSGPGKAAAGTGRSFASASVSSGNPFLLPFFVPPSLDGFALNHWIRSVEGFYDPNFAGNDKVVTAINDNGHVYGKINGVRFDNGVKSGM